MQRAETNCGTGDDLLCRCACTSSRSIFPHATRSFSRINTISYAEQTKHDDLYKTLLSRSVYKYLWVFLYLMFKIYPALVAELIRKST